MLDFNFDQIVWLGLAFILLLGFMQYWFIPQVEGVLDKREVNLQQIQDDIEALKVQIKQLSLVYEQKINDSIKLVKEHKVSTLIQMKEKVYCSHLEQMSQIHKDYQLSKQYLDLQLQQQKEEFLAHIDEFTALFLNQIGVFDPSCLKRVK